MSTPNTLAQTAQVILLVSRGRPTLTALVLVLSLTHSPSLSAQPKEKSGTDVVALEKLLAILPEDVEAICAVRYDRRIALYSKDRFSPALIEESDGRIREGFLDKESGAILDYPPDRPSWFANWDQMTSLFQDDVRSLGVKGRDAPLVCVCAVVYRDAHCRVCQIISFQSGVDGERVDWDLPRVQRQDERRVYFGRIGHGVLAAATDEALLLELERRARVPIGDLSKPAFTPVVAAEWQRLPRAQFVGVRKYRDESADVSLSSMLRRDRSADTLVVVSEGNESEILSIRYSSGDPEGLVKFEKFVSDQLPSKVGLRSLSPYCGEFQLVARQFPAVEELADFQMGMMPRTSFSFVLFLFGVQTPIDRFEGYAP